MNNTTIGSIIASLRYEKGISKRKLCQGLCSISMLSFIEGDEGDADKFLLDMLLQRLGKSSDKLEAVLTNSEYERMRARDYLEELIWKKEREKVLIHLREYSQRYTKDNTVQKMFTLRIKAELSYRLDRDLQGAEQYIRQAIWTTLPGICSETMKEYLLAMNEIENLLILAHLLLEQGKTTEAEEILTSCGDYISENVTDGEEYAKINSKKAWLLGRILVDKGMYFQALMLCEEALYQLRKYGILYFMIPLLEQMIFCSERIGMDTNKNKWQVYYDILLDIYGRYGEDWYCHDSLFHNCHQTVYHLAGELIRSKRKSKDMTQEQLSEGVYMSSKMLSFIEHGKVVPSKKKLDGLMERLGMERGKYCGTAVVENYDILELKYEIDVLIGSGKYIEAREYLDRFRKALDCKKRINQMAVEIYQNIIDVRLGNVPIKESCDQLVQLLEDDDLFDLGELYRVPFYNELLIYNMICLNLRQTGNIRKSIDIYKKIIRAVEQSAIDEKYQNNILSVVLANISYLDTDRAWCEKGISYELACGKGSMLYMHFMSQISLEEDEETRREITRLAYYLSDMFFRETNKKHIREYYEQTYHEQLL